MARDAAISARTWKLPALGLALVAGAGAVFAGLAAFSAGPSLAQQGPKPGPAAQAPAAPVPVANRPGLSGEDFSRLSKSLMPSVVNISTRQVVAADGLPQYGPGSPLEQFNDLFGRGNPGMRREGSLGSGFVIDTEGHVVTNNHVIEGADEIDVVLSDGTTLSATLVGTDPDTDLALLKVKDGASLTPVPWGDSDNAEVGQWVLAIGNPFGLGGTLTVGVISAKQRDINSGPYDDYLQTDAAINKGNSGGPLFNMEGEVIGVNTAIISPTGGSIGIGFAVPSDTAVNVVDQLRQFGETRRGWLGVKIQTITEDIAETMGVPENSGALVSAVTPDSPAGKAGIEAGDVIMRFDGKEVSTMRGLPKIVAQTPIGKAVEVEVMRRGEKKSFKVAVGRLAEDDEPREAAVTSAKPEEPRAPDKPVLGMTLMAMTDELRARFSIDPKVKGIVVVEVDPQSPAASKNIKPGDVIVEAGQDQVTTPDEMGRSVEKVRKSGRKAVLLRVEDGRGDLRFVAVPLVP